MRWRVFLIIVLCGAFGGPARLARAEQTLQQKYLNIYLKINEAEQLEQHGDYRGALDGFQGLLRQAGEDPQVRSRTGKRRSSCIAWTTARRRSSICSPRPTPAGAVTTDGAELPSLNVADSRPRQRRRTTDRTTKLR